MGGEAMRDRLPAVSGAQRRGGPVLDEPAPGKRSVSPTNKVILLNVRHLEQAIRYTAPAGGPNQFTEHLRVATMSVGTYSIPCGGLDDQVPHAEDEVYVVLSGSARFTSGDDTVSVGPGTTLFVPANEDHRFHDVTDDLAVLVVFAPPYSGRAD